MKGISFQKGAELETAEDVTVTIKIRRTNYIIEWWRKDDFDGIIELSDFPDSQWFFCDPHRQNNGSYFDIMSSPTEDSYMRMEYDEDVSRFLCERNDNSSWFYVFPATDIYIML